MRFFRFGKLYWFDRTGGGPGRQNLFFCLLLDPTEFPANETTPIRPRITKDEGCRRATTFPFQRLPSDARKKVIDFLTARDSLKLARTCKRLRSEFTIQTFEIPLCRKQKRTSSTFDLQRWVLWTLFGEPRDEKIHNIGFLCKLDSCDWDPRYLNIAQPFCVIEQKSRQQPIWSMNHGEMSDMHTNEGATVVLSFEDTPLMRYSLYMVGTELESISSAEWILTRGTRSSPTSAPLSIIVCKTKGESLKS
mmetsp:Transcript_19075/g.30757  ORF Transcript_19075/g.30757 Transcript_19075/m.30757 type:complete len:249 (-) Transcript_19075:157-903(-)